ncbi:WD40 repeat domain-containing protein [Actinomadura sp. NEAU-AAG7]|uniref:WD40 repeat domain-containing protein n=1 Tax=Actinomadura sp. NEAU-AAG7 TaxID=2839640 RepID=UPI001BE4C324|nr:hypothetical protein [Actinomadura sp. NEAU-AAG7]MBT2213153.1 hypothetical protein [Actinomadura sp. NEAU-AAG7]
MDELPHDAEAGNDGPGDEGDRPWQEPAAPPGQPAAEAWLVTRRRLLIGAGALLAARAVPAGPVVSGGRGNGDAKQARTSTRRGSTAITTAPLRAPPPAAIPARPTLRKLGTLKGHRGEIDTLRFSPDGTNLASLDSRDGVLRVWDVAGRKERATPVQSPDVVVKTVAFSPEGRTLAAGGEERAQFWDVATLRPQGVQIVKPADDRLQNLSTIVFSPDGKTFATGGFGDDEIRFYDRVTRRPIGPPLQLEGAEARIMVFSPDGRTLASVDESGFEGVKIWDVAARKQRAGPSLDVSGGAQHLVFSPDGATLAIDSDSYEVRFLAAATGKEQGRPLGGHIGSVTGLAFSTDGRTVVTSDYSGLHFWDAATHKKLATATTPGTPPSVDRFGSVTVTEPGTRTIHRFALSPDGRTVATIGFQAKSIALWHLE